MPRTARLDSPGILHHVRGRGIERRKIFLNDFDRRDFLDRLEYACVDEAATVYAYCLMPNHFHLAIRTGERPLATTMRKLLTAYVTSFNRRNNRNGHLFQNRYKSTVVDEERYFLGLVRYIHLNPLRAKLVADLDALREYPWSGHSVLMGKEKLSCMAADNVLGRFGAKAGAARKELLKFMGADDARIEGRVYKGGGLVRSAGGTEALKELSKAERPAYDERILGSGSFVEAVLRKAEPESGLLSVSNEERQQRFKSLVHKMCETGDIGIEELTGGSRRKNVVTVRRAVCYLAVRKLGMTSASVARQLNISDVAVLKAVDKGLEAVEVLGADDSFLNH